MEDESLSATLAALKGKDSELEQRIHTLEGRVTRHGGEIQGLQIGTAELDIKLTMMQKTLDTMQDTLNRLSDKVDALASVPGEHWKDVTKQVIALIVAAVVGFVITKMIGQ